MKWQTKVIGIVTIRECIKGCVRTMQQLHEGELIDGTARYFKTQLDAMRWVEAGGV